MPEETKPEATPETEVKPQVDAPPVTPPAEKPQAPVSEPPTPAPVPEVKADAPAPQTSTQSVDEAAATAAEAAAVAAEATAKAAQLELELARERMARKYAVPDALIPMLRADHVEADAKALSAHSAGTGSSFGSGGLDPTDTHDPKAEGKRLADRLFDKYRR